MFRLMLQSLINLHIMLQYMQMIQLEECSTKLIQLL